MKLLHALDRHRRQATSLSRAAWLRRAQVAESTWYRWQAGETTPSLDLIEKLAAAVKCSVALKKNTCKRGSGA